MGQEFDKEVNPFYKGNFMDKALQEVDRTVNPFYRGNILGEHGVADKVLKGFDKQLGYPVRNMKNEPFKMPQTQDGEDRWQMQWFCHRCLYVFGCVMETHRDKDAHVERTLPVRNALFNSC